MGSINIEQYKFIPFPGSSDIVIPTVRKGSALEEDTTSSRLPEWMIKIDKADTKSKLDGFKDFTELFGWYCESSRYIRGDASINFYPSGTLWHSDVFLVLQNGDHNTSLNKFVAGGIITDNITIVRLVKINNEIQKAQELSFDFCHWCGVESSLDTIFARFTAVVRENKVTSFDQDGTQMGFNTCLTDYGACEVT